MEKKPCPVDRGKLLIGLEHCHLDDVANCGSCPYMDDNCNCGCHLSRDSLAYIYYLEEQLNAKGI